MQRRSFRLDSSQDNPLKSRYFGSIYLNALVMSNNNAKLISEFER